MFPMLTARQRLPSLVAGVLAGLAAFGVCYGIVFAIVGGDFDEFTLMGYLLANSGTGDWVGVGWALYEAHGVRLTPSYPAFGVDFQSFFKADIFGPRETLWYGVSPDEFRLLQVIPPLVLAVTGGILGSFGRSTIRRGAARGALVVVGYLPAVLAGWWVFRIGTNIDGWWVFIISTYTQRVSPAPVFALLLVGVVYPVVCGGVGGAISAAVSARLRPSLVLSRGG